MVMQLNLMKTLPVKWIFIAFVIVLLIAGLSSWISDQNARKAIFDQVSKTAEQSMIQSVNQLDNEFSRVEGLAQQINYDPDIRKQVQMMNDMSLSSAIRENDLKFIMDKLSTYASSNKYVNKIVLVNEEFMNEKKFDRGIHFLQTSGSNINPSIDEQNKLIFNQIFTGGKQLVWVPTSNNSIFRKHNLNNKNILNYEGPSFALLRILTNSSSKYNKAYLQAIQLKMLMFKDLFKDIKFGDDCEVYLIHDQNQIIYSKDEARFGQTLVMDQYDNNKEQQIIKQNNDNFLVLTKRSHNTSWKLVVSIPTSQLYESVNQNLIWFVIITFSFLILFILTFLVIRQFQRIQANLLSYSSELENTKDELSIINKVLQRQSSELIRLNAVKDQILANTSHELRTPLNGIIGIAESLIDGVSGALNEHASKNLSMIVVSSRRLLNLVNDILDFAKIRNQTLPIIKKPILIQGVMEQTAILLKPLFIQKNVEFRMNISDVLPPVLVDENRFQQMLHNLISNAIKFTERGFVEVRAFVSGSFLNVEVEDSGIGIREEHVMKVFKAFEQVDGSSSRKFGGTGLGLSITKQLVEMHGGAINVRSTYGSGSCFTLILPLSESDQPTSMNDQLNPVISSPRSIEYEQMAMAFTPLQLESDELEGMSNAKFKVLVVDDEPINLQVVINHLVKQPYEIIAVSSGTEAMKRIEEGLIPDLILLDVMMPEMNGYEVTKQIRWRYPIHRLPIILLTAKTQADDLVAAFEVGANDFLTKPIQKHELIARMKTHLQLANWNMSMQIAVDERTQAVRVLFDRSEQGFMMINSGLIIQNEYSLACERIFGRCIQSVEFPALIYENDQVQANTVRSILQTIFEKPDADHVGIMIELLPNEMSMNQRTVEIHYQMIPVIAGIDAQMMIVVTDVTESRRMTEQVRLEQSRLRRVVYAISHEQEVTNLLRMYIQFANHDWFGPSESLPVFEWLHTMMRSIHTFRGHFMQVHFEHTAKQLCTIEEQLNMMISSDETSHANIHSWIYKNPILSFVSNEFNQLVELIGHDPLHKEPALNILRSDLVLLESFVTKEWSFDMQPKVVNKIKHLYYEPVTELVGRYKNYVIDLAERRGKAIPTVHMSGEIFCIDMDSYQKFSDSLIHIFRNIVEHGLETQEVRVHQQKPFDARIDIEFGVVPNHGFWMVIRDDGAGIDTRKLRKILHTRHELNRKEITEMTDDTILTYVFVDDVSTMDVTNDYAGRGSGLAAVKQFTEEAGGKVSVTSDKGKGTSFRFEFPNCQCLVKEEARQYDTLYN